VGGRAGRSRTARVDWLVAGLELLRSGGGDALTIERLCSSLNRTKGAFYHHFREIAEYHQALLAHWVESHTERLIEVANRTGDVGSRLQALARAVRKVDIGVELAVFAWSLRSETARAAVARVHARRIAYLAALSPESPNAERDAELRYAVFLGTLYLHPDPAEGRQRRRLERAFNALVGAQPG
jgi:AcrR family transcriptional regulator